MSQHYLLPNEKTGKYEITLQLPKNKICDHCILQVNNANDSFFYQLNTTHPIQWTYTCGNNWGTCPDGVSRVGCGPQETFRACADIRLKRSFNSNNVQRVSFIGPAVPAVPKKLEAKYPILTNQTQKDLIMTDFNCKPVGAYLKIPGMDKWCFENCKHDPSYCPSSHCKCSRFINKSR